ncbi:hypothetical protein VTO42DRAFT_8939 [Malbranchea cinnamomea]
MVTPHATDARPKSSVPITSSWCKRALRPLTSIILRLEKYWKAVPLGLQEHVYDKTFNNVVGKSELSRSQREGRRSDDASDSESSADDPTWAPGRVENKRVKHKYSGRRRTGTLERPRVAPTSPESWKLRPGEFMVSTPLILGKQGRLNAEDGFENACQESGSLPDQHAAQAAGRRRIAPLKSRVQNMVPWTETGDNYRHPEYLAIVQGAHIVWLNFLRTTADQHDASRGARSLFSMSLNKVSEYVLQEQERLDRLEDKDEDTDVADFIITELERTFALFGQGWKPLKQLVRTYGIRLMCQAVRKRWISPQLCRFLVLASADALFHDAAEALLSSLLSTGPRIPPPGRLDNSLFSHDPFSTLEMYATQTGRLGFWSQEMATLTTRQVVPVEWMATEPIQPILMKAIQSISSDDANSTHSARLLVTVLHAALGFRTTSNSITLPDIFRPAPKKQTRLSQTRREEAALSAASDILQEHDTCCDEFISTALTNAISSILTFLCGAHLAKLNHAATDMKSANVTSTSMKKIISFVSTTAQRGIELRYSHRETPHFSGLQSLRIGYILMADFLLNCSCLGHDITIGSPTLVNFERFLGLTSNRGELVSELSLLVLQVARCWGRSQGEDGFNQLKHLTNALTSTNTLESQPILWAVLSKVAIEVALRFAEMTCLRDHHTWALHIQEKVADLKIRLQTLEFNGCGGDDGPSAPWTPSLALPAVEFRWEDGIGEWVANSPIGRPGVRRGELCHHSGVASGGSPTACSRRTSRSCNDESVVSGESGKTSTAPSSVGEAEMDKEEELKYCDDVDDDSDALSGFQSPPLFRTKRKSLPPEFLSGSNKRLKHAMHDRNSGLRYRLRRRKTMPCYRSYEDDRTDEDHPRGVPSPSERLTGPMTRRRAMLERDRTMKDDSQSLFPRKQSDIEVVIRVPSSTTVPKADTTTQVQVVIPHSGCYASWAATANSATESRKPDDDNHPSDDEDDAHEREDDDVLLSAPVLRNCLGVSRRWSSSVAPSFSSASTSSCSTASREGLRNRQLRPRKSQSCLKGSGPISLGRVVPCPQGSSDDELSFRLK